MAHRRTAARRLTGRALGGGLALAACVAGGQPAPVAPAPDWHVDPGHTAVRWEIVHMATSTLHGRFGTPTGSIQFDPGTHRLAVGFTIDTASVDSGVPALDDLLRGKEMLAVATYPQAYFVGHDARFEGDTPRELRGEFTLRGVSQALTLKATRWNCAFSPIARRTVCGGDFEGEILRSSFGITHSLPFVADKVRLLVEVEAIAP